MTYFTSWEINVFLCLVSLGLPKDLSEQWTKKIKQVHNRLEFKNSRKYHCNRGKFVNMEKIQMLYYSRADLNDYEWHFPKAVSKLESIPELFHKNYCDVIENYKNDMEFFRPDKRMVYLREYWRLAGRLPEIIKYFEEFHSGRFYLIDLQLWKSYEEKWGSSYFQFVRGPPLTECLPVSDIYTVFVWYHNIFKEKKHIDDIFS